MNIADKWLISLDHVTYWMDVLLASAVWRIVSFSTLVKFRIQIQHKRNVDHIMAGPYSRKWANFNPGLNLDLCIDQYAIILSTQCFKNIMSIEIHRHIGKYCIWIKCFKHIWHDLVNPRIKLAVELGIWMVKDGAWAQQSFSEINNTVLEYVKNQINSCMLIVLTFATWQAWAADKSKMSRKEFQNDQHFGIWWLYFESW